VRLSGDFVDSANQSSVVISSRRISFAGHLLAAAEEVGHRKLIAPHRKNNKRRRYEDGRKMRSANSDGSWSTPTPG
jgi:hypothetical protein